MGWFMPHRRFETYEDVTPAVLREDGVRALILDIDNTLEPYENAEPREQTLAWLASLKEAGICAALVSNNGKERVERFNRDIGLPYYYKAKKPFSVNLRRAMRQMGTSPKDTALLGDQIFTDVLAARGAGLRAYLVPPIRDKKDAFTRFKRLLERPVLKRYERKKEKEKKKAGNTAI